MRRCIHLVAVCVVIVALPSTARSQEARSLAKHVVSSAAVTNSGNGFKLSATLGQPVAGISSGAVHIAHQGFWYIRASTPTGLPHDRVTYPGAFRVSAHPNPFSSNVTFQSFLPPGSDVRIIIYDIIGKVVFSTSGVVSHEGIYQFTWDGRGLTGKRVPSGMYYISFLVSGNSAHAIHATLPILHVDK